MTRPPRVAPGRRAGPAAPGPARRPASAPAPAARPAGPPAPRSREAAKEETREALLLAGLAEFAEHGLDAPSLDAICARAGKTRGAFYVHFEDREDFLVAAMERVLGPFLDAVLAGAGAHHDLAAVVSRFVEVLGVLDGLAREASEKARGSGRPPGLLQFQRLLEACARSPRVRERLVLLVRETLERVVKATEAGQGARTVRADVAPDVVAGILVSLALGVITAQELGVALDLPRLRDGVLALVAAGPGRPER